MNVRPNHAASLYPGATNQKQLLPSRKAIIVTSMSAILFALGAITSIKTLTEYQNENIPYATNPACEGLSLVEVGRSVHISAGRIDFGDKTVDSIAQTLHVPPSLPLQITGENFRLFSPTDAHPYFTRVPLACLAGGAKDGGPVGFLIDENTLSIKDQNGKKLIAEKDYRLDLRYDALERLPGSSVVDGANVKLDYKVLRKRIDTISVGRNGIFKLTIGQLSQFAPLPANVSTRELPVAHIHAISGNDVLTRSCILPISGITPSHVSIENLCTNAMNLSNTKNKLAGHQKFQLLMCGDSVCCGAFASDVEHSYPILFKKLLEDKSKTKVVLTKVSAGGKTSSDLLPDILETLAARHPDLLVLEFVNDLSLPSDQIQKNYVRIFEAANAAGAEVIVCLPHLPSPLLYGQSWQNIANKPFYQVVPSLARKHNCAVADIAYRWLHIGEEGLQPIDLLADQANHPNDYGHKIYAEELLKAIYPTN